MSNKTLAAPRYPAIPGLDIEQLWVENFLGLFGTLPHCWHLFPTQFCPDISPPINRYIDTAKVRFICNKCSHSWTSMRGRIIVWYVLFSADPPTNDWFSLANHGFAFFKLTGQKCQQCGSDEQALWYPDEVVRVVNNLFGDVVKNYYSAFFPLWPHYRSIRKQYGMQNKHRSDLCQACILGICKVNGGETTGETSGEGVTQ